MSFKKYIPFYGIKYMCDGDFLKMLIYHNITWFLFVIFIHKLIDIIFFT